MKIIHVIPSLELGGAEKFLVDLANELAKNHEVIIYSLFDLTEEMFLAKKIHKNIEVVTFNKKAGLDISVFLKIFRALKNEQPDVINTHLRGLFYSILAIIFIKTKKFHTVHSLAAKETSFVLRPIYWVLFNLFSVVPVAISNEVLKSIQDIYGVKSTALIVNGTKTLSNTSLLPLVKREIDSYKKYKDTYVFISIGRIIPVKNQLLLVNTINKMSASGRDVLLLIIGEDQSKKQEYKELLMRCDLTHTYFLGAKSNISDYLVCSDALCLGSFYEGMPITLLESLSLGVIPICTPAGGVVDVVDENIGILSDGFGVDDYYEALNKFLNLSNFERLRMESNCIKLFKDKYTISNCANNYLTEYEKHRHV